MTEAVGYYAIRIARQLVRKLTEDDDADATKELKVLYASSGPLGSASPGAWHRLFEWLPTVAEFD
ncbi:hypothetical protein ABZ707_29905 [Streptomyces sp. NPDC006923]|uniref:hypothetical protein n=1 Tax=Streptomyces sp. NPDC006923 TaxID=3155355 RepID=UPI0033D388A7